MTHLEKMLQPDSPYVFYDDQHGFCINTDDVLMLFQPEQKMGEWIKNSTHINCSVCKHCSWSLTFEDTVRSFNYCPNCGALMMEDDGK